MNQHIINRTTRKENIMTSYVCKSPISLYISYVKKKHNYSYCNTFLWVHSACTLSYSQNYIYRYKQHIYINNIYMLMLISLLAAANFLRCILFLLMKELVTSPLEYRLGLLTCRNIFLMTLVGVIIIVCDLECLNYFDFLWYS